MNTVKCISSRPVIQHLCRHCTTIIHLPTLSQTYSTVHPQTTQMITDELWSCQLPLMVIYRSTDQRIPSEHCSTPTKYRVSTWSAPVPEIWSCPLPFLYNYQPTACSFPTTLHSSPNHYTDLPNNCTQHLNWTALSSHSLHRRTHLSAPVREFWFRSLIDFNTTKQLCPYLYRTGLSA